MVNSNRVPNKNSDIILKKKLGPQIEYNVCKPRPVLGLDILQQLRHNCSNTSKMLPFKLTLYILFYFHNHLINAHY